MKVSTASLISLVNLKNGDDQMMYTSIKQIPYNLLIENNYLISKSSWIQDSRKCKGHRD